MENHSMYASFAIRYKRTKIVPYSLDIGISNGQSYKVETKFVCMRGYTDSNTCVVNGRRVLSLLFPVGTDFPIYSIDTNLI